LHSCEVSLLLFNASDHHLPSFDFGVRCKQVDSFLGRFPFPSGLIHPPLLQDPSMAPLLQRGGWRPFLGRNPLALSEFYYVSQGRRRNPRPCGGSFHEICFLNRRDRPPFLRRSELVRGVLQVDFPLFPGNPPSPFSGALPGSFLKRGSSEHDFPPPTCTRPQSSLDQLSPVVQGASSATASRGRRHTL